MGDAALSLLIAALTATLLSSPPTLLLGERDSALAAAHGLSLEVADIILDANPGERAKAPDDEDSASSIALQRPLTNALTDAFIVKPAMLLQYGQIFKDDCAKKYSDTKLTQLAYDRAVSEKMAGLRKLNEYRAWIDPTGAQMGDWALTAAKQWAVDHFGNPPMEAFEKQCVKGDVQAAKRASLDKVGGALFLLIAAVIVTVLIAASPAASSSRSAASRGTPYAPNPPSSPVSCPERAAATCGTGRRPSYAPSASCSPPSSASPSSS